MQSDPPRQAPPSQAPPQGYPPGQAPPGIGSLPGSGYASPSNPHQGLAAFTFEELAVVRAVARLAMVGAWLSIVGAAMGFIVSFYQTVTTAGVGPGGMFSSLVGAGIGIALASGLLVASKKLGSFASAQTQNVWELVGGLESLRFYFKFLGVLAIIGMVIMGLGILLVMCVAAVGAG